jgi:hypothetical protein
MPYKDVGACTTFFKTLNPKSISGVRHNPKVGADA